MIDGNQFLKEIKNRDPHLGLLLEQIIDGVNGTAQHLGVNPNGKQDPPDPVQDLQLMPGDSGVHVNIVDNSTVRKNVQYFVEWSKDPSFKTSYVEHLGASRNKFVALNAKDSSAVTHQYYWKAYSQYFGSDAQSNHFIYGGRVNPTPVSLTGSSQGDYLPSSGSGTAFPDGSQSGYGLGRDIQRQPVGPKRPPAPEAP